MPTYDKEELEALIDGKLPWTRVQEIIQAAKDTDRLEKLIEIYQQRVNFSEPIVLPLTLALFIVRKGRDYAIKCRCGYEFGDFRVNWKLYSHIYVRDTQETLDEVYPGLQSLDPSLVQIREYYCPGCFTQLEVESLPRGVPPEFELLPDLDTLYTDWLNKPLPEKVEFVDKTYEVTAKWAEETE
jgi:acetone carboxylase, gamma subunit